MVFRRRKDNIRRARKKARYLFLLLMLLGCERIRTPAVPHTHKAANIYLFAAGYCQPCKEELPAISKWYKGLVDPKVMVTVLLIAGSTPSQAPTQTVCDEYKKELNLPFAVVSDKYGRMYRKFYSDGIQLPAAVVLDKDGNAIKIFNPGKVTPLELNEAIK